MLTARAPIATSTERVELLACFVNAIALGRIGFAILRPMTESLENASLSTLWWASSDARRTGSRTTFWD